MKNRSDRAYVPAQEQARAGQAHRGTTHLWEEFRKLLAPVFLGVLIALCSTIFGEVIFQHLKSTRLWVAENIPILLVLLCVLVVALSFVLNELLQKARGRVLTGHAGKSKKALMLILMLLIAVCLGVMGACVSEAIQVLVNLTSWSGAAVALACFLLIYGLSLWFYQVSKSFQGISFDKPVRLQGPAQELGLMITLSTPHAKGMNEGKFPFSRTAGPKEGPKIDMDGLLQYIGDQTLEQLCASIRVAKKEGGETGNRVESAVNPLGEELRALSNFNWAMILMALEWLKQHGGSGQSVYFLCSDDGTASKNNSKEYLSDAKRLAEHFGFNTEGGCVNFDQMDAIYGHITSVLTAWKKVIPVIDVTGGKKTVSIVGSAVAAHSRHCKIIYVDTTTLDTEVWEPEAHNTAPTLAGA